MGKKCSHCSRPCYHHYLHCKHFITQWTIDEDIKKEDPHLSKQYLGTFQGTSKDSRCSHQGSGQAEDGEEGTGRGEGGVFANSGLLPHLYVSSSDVISQCLWYHGLPLLTQSNVTPEGTFKIVKTILLNM